MKTLIPLELYKKISCDQMKSRMTYFTVSFYVYWLNPLFCYRTDSKHNHMVVNCIFQEVAVASGKLKVQKLCIPLH